MYELFFEKRALHKLNKLENNVKSRIWSRLQKSKEDPFILFEKLKEVKTYKLRVGDYRIIADINRKDRIINILEVGHRKNIYD